MISVLKFCLKKNTFYWVSYQGGPPIPANITGSCSPSCTWTQPPTGPITKTTTSTECYTGDFANQKGAQCFVGTFGLDAQIRGCPYQNICKVTLI